MRKLMLSFLLATTACATTSTGAKPVNVYYVRADIKAAIAASPGDAGPRAIVSMGHVAADRAVVYTDAKDGRREETWVKGSAGWTLSEGKIVTAAQ